MNRKSERKPMFSVVIPIYNAGKHVNKALCSVAQQSYKDYELILINDGSTDNSLEVITCFAEQHPELEIAIVSQSNSGAGSSRNKGIDLSNGRYLVFLDADDYLESDYLKVVSDSIVNEKADVVFVDVIRENAAGRIIRVESMAPFSSLSKNEMIRLQLTGKMPWGGVRKVVSLDLVKKNNIRFASIRVGEESIYSFELLRHASSVSFEKKAKYHYVDSENSLTSIDAVDNSLTVFSYVYTYLNETNQLGEYERTIRAFAVTTMVIAINVLSQQFPFHIAYKQSLRILNDYKKYFVGKIDKLAIEKRVALCFPWVYIKLPLPIMLASKIKSWVKRIR